MKEWLEIKNEIFAEQLDYHTTNMAKQPIARCQTDGFSYFVDVCRILVSIMVYLPPQRYHRLSL
jgi:hypothetical protein